jgi:hypothetical protein
MFLKIRVKIITRTPKKPLEFLINGIYHPLFLLNSSA